MIGDILNAVLQEVQALLQQTSGGNYPGTTILETDFKSDQMTTYTMPLVILDMIDAPEASEYPGGVTRMDWVFGMNSYNLQPNAMVSDPTNYSAQLLDIIDDIRRHFSLRQWIIPARANNALPMAMADIESSYGFKFTLSGLSRANHLEQDGMVIGWRIVFDSIAIDDGTDWDLEGQGPLAHVTQSGYPPS